MLQFLATVLFFLFYSPFPTVAESIQKELDDYRSSEEEVKKLKNIMASFIDLFPVQTCKRGQVICMH